VEGIAQSYMGRCIDNLYLTEDNLKFLVILSYHLKVYVAIVEKPAEMKTIYTS
jgi:hypothetical protein